MKSTSDLYKDFEKAQVKCAKESNKNGKWNPKHFIYCEADLLNARLNERMLIFKQLEKVINSEGINIYKLEKLMNKMKSGI